MSVSTVKQMKLGHELAKDLRSKGKPRNKKELMVAAGYSQSTAEASPHVIFEQPGTINAIEVALESHGFTEVRAKTIVAEILEKSFAEDKDRLKAAELIFKVQGSFAAEKNITLTVKAEDLQRTIAEDLSRFRGSTKP